jgi:hypothetical protein
MGFRVSVSLHPAIQVTGLWLLPRRGCLPLNTSAFSGRTVDPHFHGSSRGGEVGGKRSVCAASVAASAGGDAAARRLAPSQSFRYHCPPPCA